MCIQYTHRSGGAQFADATWREVTEEAWEAVEVRGVVDESKAVVRDHIVEGLRHTVCAGVVS